jgi:hypothetical protein
LWEPFGAECAMLSLLLLLLLLFSRLDTLS